MTTSIPPLTAEYLLSRSTTTPTGCIEWTGARTTKGYGRVGRNHVEFYTHRLMWTLANGQEIPAGMLVRHSCDNPPCMNPMHLLIGSVADNARDAMERNRIVGSKLKGSQVATAKLTEDQVSVIKARLRAGATIKGLAREYGVSKYPIQQIAHDRAWRHVA